jgi:hypothetical protein
MKVSAITVNVAPSRQIQMTMSMNRRLSKTDPAHTSLKQPGSKSWPQATWQLLHHST